MSRLLESQLPRKWSAAFLPAANSSSGAGSVPACLLPPPSLVRERQEGITFSLRPFQPKPKSSWVGGRGGHSVGEMNVLDPSIVSGARHCFVSKQTSYPSPDSQPFLKDVRLFYRSEPLPVSRVFRLHSSTCWTPLHPSKPQPNIPCSVKLSTSWAELVTPKHLLCGSYTLCRTC